MQLIQEVRVLCLHLLDTLQGCEPRQVSQKFLKKTEYSPSCHDIVDSCCKYLIYINLATTEKKKLFPHIEISFDINKQVKRYTSME